MKTKLAVILTVFLTTLSFGQNKENIYEGHWINIELKKLIDQNVSLDKMQNLRYQSITFKNNSIIEIYERLEKKRVCKIKISSINKNEFEACNRFMFEVKNDTILMKKKNDLQLFKFVSV